MLVKDKETVEALKRFFVTSCLRDGEVTGDIQIIAAERIALEYLREAFKDLERFTIDKQESSQSVNAGL